MRVLLNDDRRTLSLFADLFAYPHGTVAKLADELCVRVPGVPARRFADWAAHSSAGEIEEDYCATFDLQAVCVPYVGHQLCPDPARRSLFLAGLGEVYSKEGFHPGEETGDHLTEVLRFLATARDEEQRQVLLREAILPAVERMAQAFGDEQHPYRALLEALQAWVKPLSRPGEGAARP